MTVSPNIWTVLNFAKSPGPYMPQESIDGSTPVSIFIIVAQLWKVPRHNFSAQSVPTDNFPCPTVRKPLQCPVCKGRMQNRGKVGNHSVVGNVYLSRRNGNNVSRIPNFGRVGQGLAVLCIVRVHLGGRRCLNDGSLGGR
jgi:hypothetical protein